MLSRVLSNDTTLTSLNFSNKILDENHFTKLCEGLKENSVITELNFDHTVLPDHNLLSKILHPKSHSNKLLDVLEHNKTIRKISMYNTVHISEEEKNRIQKKLTDNVR